MTMPKEELLNTADFDLKVLLSAIPPEYLQTTPVEIYKCENCKFNTEKYQNLIIHTKMVHDSEFFTCNLCNTRTKTIEAMNHHKNRKHGQELHNIETA